MTKKDKERYTLTSAARRILRMAEKTLCRRRFFTNASNPTVQFTR